MNRSLRQKHKFVWLALAVLLPLLIAAGVMFRHSEPVNESVPARNGKQ